MNSLEAGWFLPRASRERSVSCLRPSYTSPRWMHPLCRPATCFLVKPLTPHDGYDGLGPMALWEAEKHDGLSTAVLGVVWKSRAQVLEAVARRRFSDPFCQSCRSLDDHRGSWGLPRVTAQSMGMPLHSYIEVRRVKGLCSEVSHFDPS